jgi:hypothetical protein
MYPDNQAKIAMEAEKMASVKREYEQAQCASNVPMGYEGRPKKRSLSERMAEHYSVAAATSRDLERLRDIVSRHPEFEEFLEFQELTYKYGF